MALGKTAVLLVRAGEFDISFKAGQETAEEMGAVLTSDLIANMKYLDEDTQGDSIVLDDWLLVCKTDFSFGKSRQKIDTSDSCSGDYGSYVPGTPDVSISFSAYNKVGVSYRRWQALLNDRWLNAETVGDNGHITILELDGPPKDIIIGGVTVFPKQISKARGTVAVCKVLNFSESRPFAGNQEISIEISPSGDSIYSTPMRNVIMAT